MKKIVLVFILSCIYGYAQQDSISSYLKYIAKQRHIPGMSVAIVDNDKTVYTTSFGYENLETNSKLSNNSVFELASLTKPFTALAILKLVELKKIALDDTIDKFVENIPDSWKKITIYHLLTHSSGFPDQLNLMVEGSPVMDTSALAQLELLLNSKLIFEPGTNSSYSDPGYFLLGLIIEKVSNMKYAYFMKKEFFDPICMKNTQVQNKWQIIKNRVAPYRYIDGVLQNARRDYMHELPSHFGILSTITDLIKFAKSLQEGNIINKELLNAAFVSGKLKNGEKTKAFGIPYGLGWMIGDLNNNKIVEHGGFSGTHLLHLPDKNISIIVLTNLDLRSRSNPRSIAHDIFKIYNNN